MFGEGTASTLSKPAGKGIGKIRAFFNKLRGKAQGDYLSNMRKIQNKNADVLRKRYINSQNAFVDRAA